VRNAGKYGFLVTFETYTIALTCIK